MPDALRKVAGCAKGQPKRLEAWRALGSNERSGAMAAGGRTEKMRPMVNDRSSRLLALGSKYFLFKGFPFIG